LKRCFYKTAKVILKQINRQRDQKKEAGLLLICVYTLVDTDLLKYTPVHFHVHLHKDQTSSI